MNPEGKEGSHKDGGSEVWVFDVGAGQRVARIPLPNWGISIAVNSAEQPLLVATNGGFALETYDATSGDFIKTLAVETQTVFVTRGMRR